MLGREPRCWDYNSGFNPYPVVAPATNWGMGWLNNPDNPVYPPTRFAFLNNNSYADAAHPEKWSYEEKVLGWGAWPINTGRSYADDGTLNNGNTAGYQAAWWDNDTDRAHVKPTPGTFCNSSNNCILSSPPQCEVQHSGDPNCDTPYWYHTSATWKPDCSTTCGHELLTYATLRTEPGNGNNGAGTMCDKAPPGVSNPLIVDDVAASVPAITDGCGKSGLTDSGTFGFTFQPDTAGHYEAKEDLHQIGGGYADHFWYAHTRNASKGAGDTGDKASDPTAAIVGPMAVTGNWKLSQSLNAWTRVLVHLPDTGAATQQAIYTVHLGNGTLRNRVINTRSSTNRWVNLGVYHFVSGSDFQGVSLSNFTPDGQANDDIAWDSVAFAPLPGKPANMVVAMGDSFSSDEGAEDYAPESDIDAGKATWNACRRSANAWSRLAVLPGQTSSVGSLADSLSPSLDYEFTACSGAWTGNADTNSPDGAPPNGNDWGGDGQFHEISQIDSGALSVDTTLVTLSIGGNDSRFSDLAAACAATDCSDSGYTFGDDTQPLAQAEPALINGEVRLSIQDVLTDIRAKAPNAKIVLMGYPELFSSLQGNACLVEYNPGGDRPVQPVRGRSAGIGEGCCPGACEQHRHRLPEPAVPVPEPCRLRRDALHQPGAHGIGRPRRPDAERGEPLVHPPEPTGDRGLRHRTPGRAQRQPALTAPLRVRPRAAPGAGRGPPKRSPGGGTPGDSMTPYLSISGTTLRRGES
jgi:hypothetical protein